MHCHRYDEEDQEKLTAVTRQQIFSFLSNDVAVLARKLEARGGNGLLPHALCMEGRVDSLMR